MLAPIHFEEPKDILSLISHLEALPLIQRKQQFLKASDGDIYLLKDLEIYLEQTTEAELEAETLRFKTADGQNLNLLQLKQRSELVKDLASTNAPWNFIQEWNLNLYSELPLSLTTVQEITEARRLYDNPRFYSLLESNLNILEQQELYLSTLERANFENLIFLVPFAQHSADFISTMNKDLLKINAVQENKIKELLANALKEPRSEEEKELLTQWMNIIDAHQTCIKSMFRRIINLLTIHQNKIAQAPEQINQAAVNELSPLENELRSLILVTNRNRKGYKFLKNIALYGIVGLIPALVAGTLLTLTVLVSPVFLIVLIALFIAVPLMGMIKPFYNKITSLIGKIEDFIERKIDSAIISNTQARARQIAQRSLQTHWTQHFEKNEQGHESLIKQLESDLEEIQELEQVFNTQTPRTEVPPATASNLGLFQFKGPTEEPPITSATCSLN